MKITGLLITLTILVASNVSLSQELEGVFSCKVDRVFVLVMKDGSAEIYKRRKGGSAAGDTILFNYVYFADGTSTERDFVMATPEGSEPSFIMVAIIQKRDAEGKKGMFSDYWEGTDDGGGETKHVVSEDYIRAEFSLDEKLELIRYFKNDWHGFLTTDKSDSIEVLGLNCRHMMDGLEPMVRDLKASGF